MKIPSGVIVFYRSLKTFLVQDNVSCCLQDLGTNCVSSLHMLSSPYQSVLRHRLPN